MKHHVLFLSLLLLLATAAVANPRTRQQALAIAESVARSHNQQVLNTSPAKSKAKTAVNNCSSYYVFNNANSKGFTIVSGDDQLPDIVGYTTSGTFNEQDMPDALAEYLERYDAMVTSVSSKDIHATKIAQEAKARLASSVSPIEPLIVTEWDQLTPYNNLCPYYSTDNRSVTGCVATAMAQILYYYKKEVSLKTAITNYSIEACKYDWNNMLTSYSGSYTDTQANAVATLMYHCGRSVNMSYGESSSASSSSAQNAFATYFGMDSDLIGLVSRDNYTYAEWVQLIDNELESERPILYSGRTKSNAGHAYICDGRNEEGLYHINWGWGGSYNGYFDITILKPDGTGAGGSTAGSCYNVDCDMIIGITPDNGKADEPLIEEKTTLIKYNYYIPTLTITSGTRSSETETLEGTVSLIVGNKTYSALSRKYAIGIEKDGGYTILGEYEYESTLPAMTEDGRYYLNNKIYISFTYAFPVGLHRIYPLESADGGKTWKVCYGADAYPFEVVVTETTMTKGTGLYATVHADSPKSGVTNDIIVKLHNSSTIEYNGLIYVLENTTDTEPDVYYYSEMVYIPGGGSKTIVVPSYESTSTKKYYFVDKKGFSLIGQGETGTLGDINKSGSLSADDVTTISGIITSCISPSESIDVDAADINGDGVIDIQDVTKLIDKLNTKQ